MAWSIAFGIMVLFLLLALLFSSNVHFRPNGSDIVKRRIYFWLFCAISFIVGFGVNAVIYSRIEVASKGADYIAAAGIAGAVALVVYILIGIVVGFSARGKLQRWPF